MIKGTGGLVLNWKRYPAFGKIVGGNIRSSEDKINIRGEGQ